MTLNPAPQLISARRRFAAAEGTTRLEEARKELAACERKLAEFLRSEFAAIQPEVKAACAREEFGKAFDLLEHAKARHDNPQWKLTVGKEVREVSDSVYKLFDSLKAAALDARREGSADEVRRIKDRISNWGMPSFVTRFEKGLDDP